MLRTCVRLFTLAAFLPPVFLMLSVGASAAVAQSGSPLVGRWEGSFEGFPMLLTLNADGSGEFTGDPIRWKVQGRSLILTDEDGSEAYTFKLEGSQLVLSGGDLVAPTTLTRVGGAAAAKSSSGGAAGAAKPPSGDGAAAAKSSSEVGKAQPKRPGRPAVEAPRGTTAASASGAAREPSYTHEPWGLTFAVPPAWKVDQREGLLLLGSDSEPGLMIVRFARGTSLEQLVEEYGEGMSEEGVSLMPTKPAESFPAAKNRAVAGELAGAGQDGARLRGRVIAVAGPYGDAAVVLGLTTEEKYPVLKPRVDVLAASLSFARPRAEPTLEFLAGQYFYISTSSFGSTERYLNLCSNGSFYEGSEIYSAGDAGTATGQAGSGGRWTAEGNEHQGVIRVTFGGGGTQEYPYRRSGRDLSVGGRTYARYGDGSCTKRSPVYD